MARGTITPRPSKDGKRISYRVRWETRGPDGKRKHHSKTIAKKDLAEKLLTEKLQAINEGIYVDASKETLSVYLERWLEAMAPTLAESTLRARSSVVRHRIVPELGPVCKMGYPQGHGTTCLDGCAMGALASTAAPAARGTWSPTRR